MIRDLLNPSSGFLDLREDSKGVIQVAGITEVSTINAQEVRGQLTLRGLTLTRSEPKHHVLSDHGVAGEGQQTAHAGADRRQPDIVPLPRRAASGGQTAEPLSRRLAGGPLRSPFHDRPRWLGTSSTGVCT